MIVAVFVYDGEEEESEEEGLDMPVGAHNWLRAYAYSTLD